MERDFLEKYVVTEEGEWLPTEREKVQVRYEEEIQYCEDSETLEQCFQRNCGCPMSGSVQGQVGWGPEQPGPVKSVPAHGRGVGMR